MKKVAVLQDLSSFGKCSLTAAIPVLSVMGVQACPLPTAILTAQTGFPSFHCEDFTDKMHYFEEEWSKLGMSFDGIYTGFVTGEKQIHHIFRFLEKFHHAQSTLLVDPVMGDNGEAYKLFTPALLDRMKALVKEADVITPNVTECCLLTDRSYDAICRYSSERDFLKAIEEAGQQLQLTTKAKVIVTGVQPPKNGANFIGNMCFDETTTHYGFVPYNGKSYSGTGDLFASVVMGSMMRGDNLPDALKCAEQFLTASIKATDLANTPKIEGVQFERYLNMLL